MNTRSHLAPLPVADSPRALEDVLAAEIRVPMAAVRAALEGLAHGEDQSPETVRVLEAAAAEVGRLSLKLRTLVDAALAATPGEERGRLGALTERITRSLDPRARRAVQVACEDADAAIDTDVPRLSVAVAGLAEALVRAGGDVLVRIADRDGLEVRLFARGSAGALHLDHAALGGLRLSFAERELEALGFHASWRTTSEGGVRVSLRADRVASTGGVA